MSRSIFSVLSAAFEPAQVRLTRREMLRAAAAAAALPLLGGAGKASAQDAKTQNPNLGVVVIGGGLAGLMCATTLSDAGYSPLVVEPRLRAGGRVLSFSDLVTGKVVEGGGEFIGANHPTWLALANRFGLELYEVPDDAALSLPMLINGELLDRKAAEKLYEEMAQALSTLTEQAKPINADEPWKSEKAAELDAGSVGDWWNALTVSDRCKRAIRAQLENDNGAALEKLSLLGMLAMIKGGGLDAYWTESETYRCRGGNQRLATELTATMLGHRVSYNSTVTKVNLKGLSGTVNTKEGRSINAQQVVLAVPPSVWDGITFDVPLPGPTMQMGLAIKKLSAVKERYWVKAGRSGESLSDQAPGMTWDATAGLEGDTACLTAFAGGPTAEKAIAEWSTKRETMWREELEKIQPGYAENVTASRELMWPLERLTRAGYSFPAPGQVTTVAKAIRENFGHARLTVCGEHASTKFPGYMEGALESGLRAAQRILEVAKGASAPSK